MVQLLHYVLQQLHVGRDAAVLQLQRLGSFLIHHPHLQGEIPGGLLWWTGVYGGGTSCCVVQSVDTRLVRVVTAVLSAKTWPQSAWFFGFCRGDLASARISPALLGHLPFLVVGSLFGGGLVWIAEGRCYLSLIVRLVQRLAE